MQAVRCHRLASGRRAVLRLRQRGASLLFALSALVGLTIAGVAMMRTSDTSVVVAGNIGFHEAAVQSTDLSLEAAIGSLLALSTTTTDNTSLGYYASLASVSLEPPAARLSSTAGATLSDAGTGNNLRYVIERMCAGPGAANTSTCLMDGIASIYRITTDVIGPRNTSERVQLYVSLGGFTPVCAVMTQLNQEITNPMNFTGPGNCLHSNQDISVTAQQISVGEVRAAGAVNTTNNVYITGAGGTIMPNQPQITLPEINPSLYRQHANFDFRSDCRIFDRNGVLQAALVLNNAASKWNGWRCEHVAGTRILWKKVEATALPNNALLFFEGNVDITQSIGSGASPWRVSFLATGSIKSSQNTVYRNHTEAGIPAAVNNIFMMAGGDIQFANTDATGSITGMFAANEEIAITGSPTITGNFIARNANVTDPAHVWNLEDYNRLSGGINLTYNPDPSLTLWPTTVARRQWRTVER